MPTAQEIRAMLALYIADKICFDSFEDWFVQNTWNMSRTADEAAKALAAEIELRLAEFSSEHLPLEQMKSEFRDLARGLSVTNIRILSEPTVASGTAIAVPQEIAAGQLVGIGRASVYAL